MTTALACPCAAATRLAHRLGGLVVCRVCGARVEAPRRGRKAPSAPRDTTPQRWAPAPVVATDHGPTVRQRAEDPRRVWTVGDLVKLTKWAARFYGSAAPIREVVQHSGGDGHGREDTLTEEWHDVTTIHRRFEALRTGEGCTHYQVLWRVIFERGGNGAELGKGAMAELGRAFATRAQRAEWAAHKQHSLRDALPREAGRRLWDAARAAWEVGA